VQLLQSIENLLKLKEKSRSLNRNLELLQAKQNEIKTTPKIEIKKNFNKGKNRGLEI